MYPGDILDIKVEFKEFKDFKERRKNKNLNSGILNNLKKELVNVHVLFVLPYRSVFVFVLLNKENIFLEKELSFYCVIKEGRSLFVFQEVLQRVCPSWRRETIAMR